MKIDSVAQIVLTSMCLATKTIRSPIGGAGKTPRQSYSIQSRRGRHFRTYTCRLEVADDVIFGRCVGPIVLDKFVKYGDPCLNHSRDTQRDERRQRDFQRFAGKKPDSYDNLA